MGMVNYVAVVAEAVAAAVVLLLTGSWASELLWKEFLFLYS